MLRKIAIAGLLLLTGIWGCDRQKDSFPSGIYLKKVIYHQQADQVRQYQYNSAGLLASRTYTFNNTITEKFDYQYKNGLVSRINYFAVNSNTDVTLVPKGYLMYEYDAGKIRQVALYPNNINYSVNYGANQRVSELTGPSSFIRYEYDQAGVLTKSVLFSNGQEVGTHYYAFDNKRNPFFQLDPIHESANEPDFISYKLPNNLIKKVFVAANHDTISESEYVFKYNSNNLPTESYELFTSESNGYYRDSINHRLYEYEVK